MPRDGLGIFTAAAPDVVTQTTIDSGVHNGLVHDFVIDANAKRPIIAGGTAADNAKDARTNLKAEVAGVQVTNYDTQVWENGSFWSDGNATGGPAAVGLVGHAVLINNTQTDVVLIVREHITGKAWGRTRVGGAAWSPWGVDGEGAYVNVVGDTMTGHLGLPVGPAAHQAVRKDYVDAADAAIASTAAGSSAAALAAANAAQGTANTAVANAAAANANADTRLLRTTDTLTGDLTVTNAVFSQYLYSGGGGQITGNLNVGASINAINVYAAGQVSSNSNTFQPLAPGQAAFRSTGEYGGGYALNSNSGAWGALFENGGYICLGAGNASNVATGLFKMDPGGHMTINGHGWQPGGGTWGDSASDARVKTVVRDYESGLDEILGLHPVVYTFKGNDGGEDSPHKAFAASGKEFTGLIAQEAETAMPELVVKRAGIINGQPVDDFRMLDTSSLIYALVNAVKQLAARVEELEAEAGR
jgi:hypothetical protein